MPQKNYVSVSLPKTIIEKVDELIASEKTSYTSRADLIKDAIRIRLRELDIIK